MAFDKVYHFKAILDGDDAVNYLAGLINCYLSGKDFIEIGTAQGLRTYIDPCDVGNTGKDARTGEEVTLNGWQEVVEGLDMANAENANSPYRLGIKYRFTLPLEMGTFVFRGESVTGENVIWRPVKQPLPGGIEYLERDSTGDSYHRVTPDKLSLYFKPDEIEALAETLNSESPAEAQPAELEAENKTPPTHSAVTGDVKTPKTLGPAQERLILDTLRNMGHDPQALPRQRGNKPGAKAQAWAHVKGGDLFVSKDAFDSVWKRLSCGEIKYS